MITHVIQQSINTNIQASLYSRLSLAILLSILLFGCTNDQPTNYGTDFDSEELVYSTGFGVDKKFNEADSDLVKTVIQATARYHSTTQAEQAGYEADEHCVAVQELGGMGYHWVNESLVDPVFDPAQPEVLLYEKDKNGNLKLVAVEYIVIDVGQDHPYFGDHPFDIGGTPIPDDHWSLHVWLWKDNPDGLFAPFNANLVCQ